MNKVTEHLMDKNGQPIYGKLVNGKVEQTELEAKKEKVLWKDLFRLGDQKGDCIIEELNRKLEQDKELKHLILSSLEVARSRRFELNEQRRDYFNVSMFPNTIPKYLDFLRDYYHYIPDQSDEDWNVDNKTGVHKEVYLRIVHFHFLVDQNVTTDISGKPTKANPQFDPWFRCWMVFFTHAWGEYLDSPGSMDDDRMEHFKELNRFYRVSDSLIKVKNIIKKTDLDGNPSLDFVEEEKSIDPTGWVTFNQFFARKLKGGLRPISYIQNNYIPSKPADSTFRQWFPISSNGNVIDIEAAKD